MGVRSSSLSNWAPDFPFASTLVQFQSITDLASDRQGVRCAELGAAGMVGHSNETPPQQCGSNGPIATFFVRTEPEKRALMAARRGTFCLDVSVHSVPSVDVAVRAR